MWASMADQNAVNGPNELQNCIEFSLNPTTGCPKCLDGNRLVWLGPRLDLNTQFEIQMKKMPLGEHISHVSTSQSPSVAKLATKPKLSAEVPDTPTRILLHLPPFKIAEDTGIGKTIISSALGFESTGKTDELPEAHWDWKRKQQSRRLDQVSIHSRRSCKPVSPHLAQEIAETCHKHRLSSIVGSPVGSDPALGPHHPVLKCQNAASKSDGTSNLPSNVSSSSREVPTTEAVLLQLKASAQYHGQIVENGKHVTPACLACFQDQQHSPLLIQVSQTYSIKRLTQVGPSPTLTSCAMVEYYQAIYQEVRLRGS
ncbi:hypothetical protein PCANC_16021 [Puccinia coronata f. sp. avenae]|uniref:Uncharacterized protein n=1 Tax=Puccinia coronata f. sp. avenae TaxID=200324 RepID=A0A2N5ULQ7_9BASI|nr:hypothetical protein PCANC_16021 [Puccinia coronata f. sp. avenae]